MTIMVVDDHASTRDTVSEVIEREGHKAVAAADAKEAVELFERGRVDVVLTDYRLPDRDGLEVLREIRDRDADVPVVMITGHGTDEIAVEALVKLGARDYIAKPLDLDRLRLVIRQNAEFREVQLKNAELQRALGERDVFKNLVGNSSAMEGVRTTIRQIAPTGATVLIYGESGTGKELVADAIHASSDRSDAPFVKVAVAALPRDLLESELFGHEKGAFTGAHKRRIGRFEMANGGTLFLDEIGEMPLETQVKLLRVLESRQFERVGGTETLECDIRLVCASNRDLAEEMNAGNFRQDLYFRINVLSVAIPPLRDRIDDVPLLLDNFLKIFSRPEKRIKRFSKAALERLTTYDWPGNVRELRNLVERVSITAPSEVVTPEDLPAPLGAPPQAGAVGHGIEVGAGMKLKELERQAIIATLEALDGNKTQAAKSLGIGLKTLYRKIKEYGI